MMTKVRMFGGFRKYVGRDTHIEIEQTHELTVGQVKQKIGEALQKRDPQFADFQLLQDSALANEEHVFSSEDRVPAGIEIAILPPVCGG